jgi:hypothetical protein
MAVMIPNDVEEFGTEGEKIFYRFLEAVAKPDGRYLCWYLPDIKGQEPDFLFFCQDVGLIIFEVKDWALGQIVEANPHSFFLRVNGREEPRKNPFKQAHDYVGFVKDKIREDGLLVSKELRYSGKPRIPISCGVAFPNINKSEYIQRGLDKVISSEKIFFWDDFHPMSDICSDASGQCFLRALQEKFPPIFPFTVNPREVNHLKDVIFPMVRIQLPRRAGEDQCGERADRLKVLDNHQEAIARKYDGGHRIILGPSGSGKTLILVHKAAFLRQYNPKIKSILFVCYNITLVNYIKRLLSEKKVPMGESGVEVLHFFELCSKILDQEIAYEKEELAYYDLIVQETLSKIPNSKIKYDAILVDEGQDFSDDMLRVITSILNEKTNNLTIALDEGQNIYRRKQTWKELGVETRGRIHRVSFVYRSTREIYEFASKFIGDNKRSGESKAGEQRGLFPDLYEFRGPSPQIKQFGGTQEVVTFVAEAVKKTADEEGCPYSDIAVLYTVKSPENGSEKNIPRMVGAALERKGILSNWVSRDYKSKRSYDVTTNSVTISTIQSAKGFDYSCVFLVGLDLLDPVKCSEEQALNLTYVGITRARYQLVIPYVQKNDLINRLGGCL